MSDISELRVAMLSPEAERVLRYLVEVEELAEAVLSDKRQVREAAASSVRKRAGSRSERLLRWAVAFLSPCPYRSPGSLSSAGGFPDTGFQTQS